MTKTKARKPAPIRYEHGTVVYWPEPGTRKFRIVGRDRDGVRIYGNATSEELARKKARDFEARRATGVPVRPGNLPDSQRTVRLLAAMYEAAIESRGLSLRYRNRQEQLIRLHIVPVLGHLPTTEWNSDHSETVLARVRRSAPGRVTETGSCMRSLVTHARKIRWLTQQHDDPMFGVSYSAKAKYEGQEASFIPRSSLPIDTECEKQFVGFEEMGWRRTATALRVAHRGGQRFSEWIVHRPCDVDLSLRTIRIYWALDLDRTEKPTKNEHRRSTIFPPSLLPELTEAVGSTYFDETASDQQHEEHQCRCGLLFPADDGGYLRYSTFHQWWIKVATAVGWPMTKPLQRSRGYGRDQKKGKGWRWTGRARWSPHDLRDCAACWMLFDLKADDALVAFWMGHHSADYTRKKYVGTRGNVDETGRALTEGW